MYGIPDCVSLFLCNKLNEKMGSLGFMEGGVSGNTAVGSVSIVYNSHVPFERDLPYIEKKCVTLGPVCITTNWKYGVVTETTNQPIQLIFWLFTSNKKH